MSDVLCTKDPRAIAAAKSRARIRRRDSAHMNAMQDAYLVEIADLRRALDKHMRREAAETVRANYWRAKARVLKRG